MGTAKSEKESMVRRDPRPARKTRTPGWRSGSGLPSYQASAGRAPCPIFCLRCPPRERFAHMSCRKAVAWLPGASVRQRELPVAKAFPQLGKSHLYGRSPV